MKKCTGVISCLAVLGLCLSMATEVFGQGSVEVFKDGLSVGTVSSIEEALTGLVPDTLDGNYELVVAEGSYNEIMHKRGNLKVGIVIDQRTYNPETGVQHTMAIRAAEGATVWLGGPGSETVTRRMQIHSTADNVTLKGLRVSNATDMGIWVELPDGTMFGVDDLTIEDCEFSDANNGSTSMEYGIMVAGGRLDRRLRFIGNRIYGVNRGIHLRSGQGDENNYAKVMHNVIYNLTNEDPSEAAAIIVSPNPSLVMNPDRIEISNNTLYNFGTRGIWLQATRKGEMPTNIRIRNNLIWAIGNGSTCIKIDEPEGSNPGPHLEVSDYNDLYATEAAHIGEWGTTIASDLAAWQSVSLEDGNSLSTDPLFADVNGDFHLLSAGGRWCNGQWVVDAVTSPCIDAGQPGTDPADYNLEPDPNGGRANQGAYGGTAEASKTFSGQVPPVADFVGDPTSGNVPLYVEFTDQSSGNPTEWNWDFGDGGTSDEQNPSHEYTSVGIYTVSLTASNAYGSDTETKTGYIAVTEPGQDMYVYDIVVTREDLSKGYKRGVATVTIYDNGNSPVVDATVTGDFSGKTTDPGVSAVTGSDGKATLYSSSIKGGGGEWCFEVTNVTHAALMYNPSLNNVTKSCESGNVFTMTGANSDVFVLDQAYPNPFASETDISYIIPTDCKVRLEVYNLLGRKVATLVDAWQSAGTHTVSWSPEDEPMGVYFYRITACEFTAMNRMILIR